MRALPVAGRWSGRSVRLPAFDGLRRLSGNWAPILACRLPRPRSHIATVPRDEVRRITRDRVTLLRQYEPSFADPDY
jgi:hypothetical protein